MKKTSIPLKILFKYPPAAGMNSFWGGIQNSENEMEAYELLSLSEENADVIEPEIPTMHYSCLQNRRRFRKKRLCAFVCINIFRWN